LQTQQRTGRMVTVVLVNVEIPLGREKDLVPQNRGGIISRGKKRARNFRAFPYNWRL